LRDRHRRRRGLNYLQVRSGRLRIQQKHRLTHLLVESFVAAGLLVPETPAGQTRWYRKGPASPGAGEIERLALPCYREMVVAEVGADDFRLKRALYGVAGLHAPWLVRAWRRLRPER
jgi:hypothetical protein